VNNNKELETYEDKETFIIKEKINNYVKKSEKNNKTLSNLKLDLSKVNNLAVGNGNMKENEQIVGFHQEFMSRMNEFSESWRDAAMKERK